MANFEIIANNTPIRPPDTPTFIPAPPPKWAGDANTGPQSTKAGNANDGGALWWDHDDPGQSGHQGYPGAVGAPAQTPSASGGSTPPNSRFTISQTINGNFTIALGAGNGQPGGKGGRGGDGGEGQDGGNSDDEQPAGFGGQGGNGGQGGQGGDGGNGGDINQFDLTVGVDVNTSQISVQYTQGSGGLRGDGGDPGNGGPGGIAGDNGQRQIPGFQGLFGNPGNRGNDGIVAPIRVIA